MCEVVVADGVPRPWSMLRRGDAGGVHVYLCRPEPCFYGPASVLRIVHPKPVSVEERGDVVVVYRGVGRGREVYTFPRKVWEAVKRKAEDRLLHGKGDAGILLVGPPGTGKSSMMKIIADMYAVPVIDASPDRLINKYIGESEKQVRRVFQLARKMQPAVILMDEAEWLLRSRSLGGGEDYGNVMANMVSILLQELQRITDRGDRVLVVAATNVKEEALDPALRRSGRFGEAILVPLPGVDVLAELLRELGVDKPREKAKACVGLGLSVSGCREYAVEGKRVRRKSGRGYRRIYVDARVEPPGGVSDEEYSREIFMADLSRASRVFLYGPYRVGLALAAAASPVPLIEVTDYRYVDEAVHMANMLRCAIIAPSSAPPTVQQYLDTNLEYGLILAGKQAPAIETTSVGIEMIVGYRVRPSILARALGELYGFTCDEKKLRCLDADPDRVKKLEEIAYSCRC